VLRQPPAATPATRPQRPIHASAVQTVPAARWFSNPGLPTSYPGSAEGTAAGSGPATQAGTLPGLGPHVRQC
jgi:hypothetical protein